MNGTPLNLHAATTVKGYYLVSFIIALLFCTYLRVSFLFIYPLFVVALFYAFNWKLDRNAVYLLAYVIACWLFSFRDGVFLKYNLVSLYFFVPFILLLFALPRPNGTAREYLHPLMYAISVVMVINNFFGIYQYIRHPYDDSFEGLYGTFTVTQNGLSLVNAILFFYHITLFQHRKRKIFLVLAVFFIICSVMGFYGAGLIAFIGAIILTFLRLRIKNIIALCISLVLIIAVAFLVMKTISPLALDYNVNIIKKFLDPAAPGAPRKLTIFRNYYNGYTNDIIDLLFGSGPGTFNSRSAFVVGSPTYFHVDALKSSAMPEYFRDYAYPLWNATNTGPYDGFMNQPFTSLLALLGEYGLLFTLGALYVLVKRFRIMVKNGNALARTYAVSTEFKLYKFATLLAFLLLVIDNYMEYPEIIALLLVIAKLSAQKLRTEFRS